MKNIGLYNDELSVPRKEDVEAVKDAKQDKITATGILKGDGSGAIEAAVADEDYATCTNLFNGNLSGSLLTYGALLKGAKSSLGENSFAEGESYASGDNAHSEGILCYASGNYSHAEGISSESSGESSHAENDNAIASGKSSHAEGYLTRANHYCQHVEGEYNIEDNSTATANERGNYIHIAGNGIARGGTRSNAHTLDWSGNAWFAGDVYVGSTSGKNRDDGSKKLITADEVPTLSDTAALALGTASAGTSTEASRADHVHPSEIFVATYGTTTYAEVDNAFKAGKVLFAKNSSDDLAQYTTYIDLGTEQQYIFSFTAMPTSGTWRISSTNVWTQEGEAYVPNTTTINNKALSSNITLTADDVSAIPSTLTGTVGQVLTKTASGQMWSTNEPDIFIATYGTTTFDEIETAYYDHKAVLCTNGKYTAELAFISSSDAVFSFVIGSSLGQWKIGTTTGGSWVNDGITVVSASTTINGKDLYSNITLGAMYSATLTSAGWTTSGDWKTQTVTVTGLKATYNAAPFVDVSLTGTDATGDAELAAAWLGISETLIADTAANSITVKFPATVDTPTANIPITITTYD